MKFLMDITTYEENRQYMSFYVMENSPRRITNFIRSEAYKWLQNKIKNEEYVVRKGKASRNLINRILSLGFTKQTYKEFLECFENNPYSYAIQPDKLQAVNSIHTNNVMNYFVEYHGEILPIGFIVELFEDDYETESEIQSVIEGFLKFSQDEFAKNYQNCINEKQDEIDAIATDCECGYKTTPKMFITGVLMAIFAVAVIYFSIFFFDQIEFIPVMEQFCGVENFEWYSDIDISNGMDKEISAYIPNSQDYLVSGDFCMNDYLSIYSVRILLVLVALVLNLIFVINQIYFFIVKIVNNIVMRQYISSVTKLDAIGIQGIINEDNKIAVGSDRIIDKFEMKISKLYSKNMHRLTKYDVCDDEREEINHIGKLRSSLEGLISSKTFLRMGLYYGGSESRGMSGLRWFYLIGVFLLAAVMSIVLPEVQELVDKLIALI